MELKAKLKSLQPIIERANFKSRKVWVTTEDNPQFPQVIEIELQQDKVTMLDGVSIGAPINLHLNLRGREWTSPEGKTSVWNTLVCWKVEGVQAVVQQAPVQVKQPLSNITEGPDLDDGLLPF